MRSTGDKRARITGSRSLAAAALAASLTGVLLAQERPPTFRSGQEVLTIQAAVRTSDGRPVTDLRDADFHVRIDGAERRVVSARRYGADAGRLTNAQEPIARFTRVTDTSPGRVVIFVIDRESIAQGSERAIFETASKSLEAFSPHDAIGVVEVPGAAVEPTRNHAAVRAVIEKSIGTAPAAGLWQHDLTWDEALALERRDATTIARVLERECPQGAGGPRCITEVNDQARVMALMGRTHAERFLTILAGLAGRLATVRAPAHLVILSGGLANEIGLTARYRTLQEQVARSRVTLSVVHVDYAGFNADRRQQTTELRGREYATGLANIASSTGGQFFSPSGRAQGAFDRITTDITEFYEIGVELKPSDADGKTHRVQVSVSREGVIVRAPAEIAAVPAERSADALFQAAMSQPVDVAELPLDVATYVTLTSDPARVRVILAAQSDFTSAPSDWGYEIRGEDGSVSRQRIRVTSAVAPWSATTAIELPVGRYTVRVGAVDAAGRIAMLERPVNAAFRRAGDVDAGDLMVGVVDGGQLAPRARVRQGIAAVATIELTSTAPLKEVRAVLQMTPAGSARPSAEFPMVMQTRSNDRTIVMAQAALDTAALAPGTYTASAVFARGGTAFLRVSRIVDVDAGTSAVVPPVTVVPTPSVEAGDGVLARAGQYAAGWGEQAALIVGVEHYEQRQPRAPVGQPSGRRLVAEIALLKASDAIGWVAYRDVMEVDGKAVGDRRNRLEALLSSGTPDLAAARRIADEGSRFNIGPVRRNFNEPTAMLFFMLPVNQRRFAFSRNGSERIDGVEAARFDFRETTKPTLIRTASGEDVPSRGSVWVLPDGTIVRTRLFISGFTGFESRSEVDVTFAREARLGLWLPAKMTERHEGLTPVLGGGPRPPARQTEVTAIATYDGYKRFETSAIIK